MSISAVSSSLATGLSQANPPNLFKQLQQDFKQLNESLQSGDLSAAQQAYTSIQKLMGSNVTGSQQASGSTTNPIQSDFAALGQALQSGDLSTAQSAFTQLQQDLQAQTPSAAQSASPQSTQGTHHHHHHHNAGASSSDTSSSSTGTTTTIGGTSSTNSTISLIG